MEIEAVLNLNQILDLIRMKTKRDRVENATTIEQ